MGLVTSGDTYQATWEHLTFDGEESHEVVIDDTAHTIWLTSLPNGEWTGQVFHDNVSGMKAHGATRDVVFDLLLKEARWSRDCDADNQQR
jgi:hypothetical protein